MAKHIWITYSWKDNERGDVDYIRQELQRGGLEVHLDKWELRAGHRLWEQIDQAIASRDRCDAWMIVATQNSLASEPCKEEVAYALNQALSVRGSVFPVIALFQGAVEASLLPQALSTRLCVSCTDNDWIERIVAAAEGRAAALRDKVMDPYDLQIHDLATTRFAGGPAKYAIEVRPRAGIWAPFFVAIPIAERDRVAMDVKRSARGNPGPNVMKSGPPPQPSSDGAWWCEQYNEEASTTQSYFIWCKELPSKLHFGAAGGPQYEVIGGGVP